MTRWITWVNQLAETYEATDESTRASLAFRKLTEG